VTELRAGSSQAMALMRAIARRCHELSGDLQSLGYEGPLADSDAEMIAALEHLSRQLDSVDGLVAERRKRTVAGQLRKLVEIHSSMQGLKLHFGAGGIRLAGWVNVDAPPADLSLNVARGIPLPSGCATHIFASHLLEHLYYPGEASRFISECRRLLSPGGVLRLIVPDIGACIRAYAADDRSFFQRRREQWEGWPENRTMLEDFLAYAGAFPDPAAFFETHKYGYDFGTLAKLLGANGFADVTRSDYMASSDPELQIDDQSSVASAGHDHGRFSLFVEAR